MFTVNLNDALQLGSSLISTDPNVMTGLMILGYLAANSNVKIKVSCTSGKFDLQFAFSWRSKA